MRIVLVTVFILGLLYLVSEVTLPTYDPSWGWQVGGTVFALVGLASSWRAASDWDEGLPDFEESSGPGKVLDAFDAEIDEQ